MRRHERQVMAPPQTISESANGEGKLQMGRSLVPLRVSPSESASPYRTPPSFRLTIPHPKIRSLNSIKKHFVTIHS